MAALKHLARRVHECTYPFRRASLSTSVTRSFSSRHRRQKEMQIKVTDSEELKASALRRSKQGWHIPTNEDGQSIDTEMQRSSGSSRSTIHPFVESQALSSNQASLARTNRRRRMGLLTRRLEEDWQSLRPHGPISDLFRNVGNIEEIHSIIDQAKNNGSLSSDHYVCAVHAACSLGNFHDAWDLFDEALPAQSTSSNIVGIPGQSDSIERRSQFVTPNASLFSTGIWLCSLTAEKEIYFDKALQLYDQMQRVYGVRPTPKTCAIVLRMCVYSRKIRDGLRVYQGWKARSGRNKKMKHKNNIRKNNLIENDGNFLKIEREIKNLGLKLGYLNNPAYVMNRGVIPYYRKLCLNGEKSSNNETAKDAEGDDSDDDEPEYPTSVDRDTLQTFLWLFSHDLRRRLTQTTMSRRMAESEAGQNKMNMAIQTREEILAKSKEDRDKEKLRVELPLVKGSDEWKSFIHSRQECIDNVFTKYLSGLSDSESSSEDSSDHPHSTLYGLHHIMGELNEEEQTSNKSMKKSDFELREMFVRYMSAKAECGDIWTVLDCLKQFLNDESDEKDEEEYDHFHESPSESDVSIPPSSAMFKATLESFVNFPQFRDYFDSDEMKLPFVPYDPQSPEDSGIWPLIDYLMSEMMEYNCTMDPSIYGLLFRLCRDDFSSEECGNQPANIQRLFGYYVAMIHQSGQLLNITRPLPRDMIIPDTLMQTANQQTQFPSDISDDEMQSFLQSMIRCMHHQRWSIKERTFMLDWFMRELNRLNIVPSAMTLKLFNKHFNKTSKLKSSDAKPKGQDRDLSSSMSKFEQKMREKKRRLRAKDPSGLT